jgi:hypothetical protein
MHQSPGAKDGPLRRGNFDKMSGWPEAAQTCIFMI